MTGKRYTVTLGLNNEIEDIIDNCKQGKILSVLDFIKQVNEQDKAFKELKKENKKLKQKIEALKIEIAELRESENDNYNITDGLW